MKKQLSQNKIINNWILIDSIAKKKKKKLSHHISHIYIYYSNNI